MEQLKCRVFWHDGHFLLPLLQQVQNITGLNVKVQQYTWGGEITANRNGATGVDYKAGFVLLVSDYKIEQNWQTLQSSFIYFF